MKYLTYKYKAIFLVSALFFFSLFSSAIEFEKCNKWNQKYTEYLINKSELVPVLDRHPTTGGACIADCKDGDFLKRINHKPVPLKCYLSSVTSRPVRGKRDGHIMCTKRKTYIKDRLGFDGKKKSYYASRPCANENYIKMLSLVKQQVASCIGLDSKLFFALLNHESRFSLNARSPTRAMCLGQMTQIAAYEVNTRFINPATGSIKKLNLLKNSCKQINKKFKYLKMNNDKNNISWNRDCKDCYKKDSPICELTHNPYTCLMYSGLYFKHMQSEVSKVINKDIYVVRNRPSKCKKGFFSKHAPPYIFLTADLMNDFLRKGKANRVKHGCSKYTPRTESKPFISSAEEREKIKALASLWAYNGGVSAIRSLLDFQITEIDKRKLNGNVNLMRKQWLSKGIKASLFKKEFRKTIEKRYKAVHIKSATKKRAQEVAIFVDKTLKDANSIVKKTKTNECQPYWFSEIPINMNAPKITVKEQKKQVAKRKVKRKVKRK